MGNKIYSFYLSVLGQLELHGTSDLLHGLGLSSRSDTRHRQTDINGGSDTCDTRKVW